MPQTHDLGRLFVHRHWHPVDRPPCITRTKTVEVEEPYRTGKGVAIRWWGRQAIVIGWWGREGQDEDSALYAALDARDLLTMDDLYGREGAEFDG